MPNSNLVNGSLGIVQSFGTRVQMNLHGAQGAGVQQNEKAKELTEGLRPPLPQRYPVVLFSNGQKMLCAPASFEVLNGKGEVEATRDQVCVILQYFLRDKLLTVTWHPGTLDSCVGVVRAQVTGTDHRACESRSRQRV